jgi:hypothetical protein
MANISNYDAKIYFWGMVFFASVSFIALPLTAFIYIDNLVLNARIDKTLQQLEQREKKKYERANPTVDQQTTSDSGASGG